MLSWKPLSITTKALMGVSLCFSATAFSTSAVAAACQPGETGCVLPVGEGVTPPAVVDTTPGPVIIDDEPGMNWLLPVLGALALAAVLFFVLDGGDEEPESP